MCVCVCVCVCGIILSARIKRNWAYIRNGVLINPPS